MQPRRPTAAPIVLTILALSNLLSYAARNVPFAVYDDLRLRFHVDEADLGWLGTAFMLPHALATLPVGWLADRVDRRRVLAAGIVLWSAAGILGALAGDYRTVLATRVLVGLGTAAVVPVANAMLGERYAGRHKAFALAVFNLGLFLGGATGFGVGGALGYPDSWLAIGGPGFAVALAVLLIAGDRPDRPPGARVVGGPTLGAQLRGFLDDVAAVMALPTMRRLMLACVVMAFAAGGYLAWLLDFLQTDKGMSKQAATGLFGGCMVAGLAGVVTGGRVGDALRRRRAWGRPAAIAIAMTMTVPFAVGAILLPAGIPLSIVAAGMMFFISWYHGPMAASVDDLAPPARAASAQAVVIFTMHLLGTTPSSRVIGEIYVRWGARPAMFVATGAVALAALLITRTFSTFERDLARRAAGK